MSAGWSAAGGRSWFRGGRGRLAAAGRLGGLAGEGRAVLEHGVDLPALAVRCALDPELVLLGVAAGGAALVDRGQTGLRQAGLLGVDLVDVGHLDTQVVERAALAGVLEEDQL